jgi:hypothetical protein
MDYIAALTPPLVMAVGFTALVVTIVKNQGGANKAKEDAAVDAALNATGNDRSAARVDTPDAAGRETDG